MAPKSTPKRQRDGQGKDNWKRKRESSSSNNPNKDQSSQPRPPKKRKQVAHESSHSDSPIPPNLNSNNKPTDSSRTQETAAAASTAPNHTPADPLHPLLDPSSYAFTTLNIISSTRIQKKVTQTLDLLAHYPAIAPAKPGVVVLRARAPVATKAVTVAEIAKREVARGGGKWFQYTSVQEVMVEVERKGDGMEKKKEEKKKEKKKGEGIGSGSGEGVGGEDGDGDEVEDEVEDEEESTAFETMKTPFERAIEGKPKIRGVPVITIYLSRHRIDSLRKTYGEQTNALEAPR